MNYKFKVGSILLRRKFSSNSDYPIWLGKVIKCSNGNYHMLRIKGWRELKVTQNTKEFIEEYYIDVTSKLAKLFYL